MTKVIRLALSEARVDENITSLASAFLRMTEAGSIDAALRAGKNAAMNDAPTPSALAIITSLGLIVSASGCTAT